MKPLALGLGILLALAGIGWFLQGINVLTAFTSFMVGDSKWAVIGAITALIGVALIVYSRRMKART